jgi:hypothetical protein
MEDSIAYKTLICGRIFETADGTYKVIPKLHSKNSSFPVGLRPTGE